jgi:hypothetical protein
MIGGQRGMMPRQRRLGPTRPWTECATTKADWKDADPALLAADGSLGATTVVTVTLAGDHRVWDGALAAQWLGALKKRLEHPLSILI